MPPRPVSSTPANRSSARPSAWSATFEPARNSGELFLQWLKVDQIPDIAKDPKRYPQFNEVIASDLRTSLDLVSRRRHRQ